MPIEILMPALSPTMEEGNLATWVKSEGDTVEAGDVIAEIETDKATMEVEAVDEGKLAKILISAGTEGVAVNTPIAILLEEGEDESALDGFEASAPNQDKTQDNNDPQKSEAKEEEVKEEPAPQKSEPQEQKSAPATNSGRVFASPLAKRIAEQNNIDLGAVNGSGPRGRIVRADVETAIEQGTGKASAAPQAAKAAASGALPTASGPSAKELADMLGMSYTEEKVSNMRKTIAKRLTESKVTVPHFYLTVEIALDNLLATRKTINTKADGAYKISVNDFILKGCAMALKAVPAANSSWNGDTVLTYDHADVSVAVATPTGLITPIVKAAETKGLREISEEMKDLAIRARDGKLKPTEYQGGTFSLSNLGMFGISEFGAIINPPQGCILAVGTGERKPVVNDKGEVVVETRMKATLSVDHRVVDGAVGAQFLQVLKQYLEDPAMMLV